MTLGHPRTGQPLGVPHANNPDAPNRVRREAIWWGAHPSGNSESILGSTATKDGNSAYMMSITKGQHNKYDLEGHHITRGADGSRSVTPLGRMSLPSESRARTAASWLQMRHASGATSPYEGPAKAALQQRMRG